MLMSSSPSFRASSPVHGTGNRKSQFTYRQLSQLASHSTSSPLRVIAHIDLDAFYAQCEMVRLGVSEDKPLAVQQWQGLIAINYPARKFGIGRHCTVTEAKKLCPELVAQHVATWREGDDKWAYRDDAAANIASDKVSLDPYRLQSRKILTLIKESLPPTLQKVEKASIDEVFCDLSAHVHSILLERFPELNSPPPYDDPTVNLPKPSVVALDWQADALVDLDEDAESRDPDWDDVTMLIGSEIVRSLRAKVRERLGYTCSAGVANNKMLSKLGSAHKKPNQQTVIRNRAVEHFLYDFKFTKIRNLGGKLGDHVVSTFHTDTVKELLPIPLDQLKSRLGEDTGPWVYNIIRGIDPSEVNPRTQIKSMLSAKSFRPTINTPEQAIRWLRIFAADIFSRLVEEGVQENKRRPKTINLHHRHDGQTKSRQGPIPQGKPLDEQVLFDLANNLLNHIIMEDRVWPCANLSLSVGGFEDGVTGNMGIGAFLIKGEEAQALKQTARESSPPNHSDWQASKRRRTNEPSRTIQRYFTKQSPKQGQVPSRETLETGENDGFGKDTMPDVDESAGKTNNPSSETPAASLLCSRCNASFAEQEDLQSHQDWHMAKDIQEEERSNSTLAHRPNAAAAAARGRGGSRSSASTSRRGGRGGRLEHGQSKLKFG